MQQSFGNSPGSPKEIRGTRPAGKSLSDDMLCSSTFCAFGFELVRIRVEGDESVEEAAVVDVAESRLDVEETDRAGDVVKGTLRFLDAR
jgi:hypothetical protein